MNSLARGVIASILRGFIAAFLARFVVRGFIADEQAQDFASFVAFFLVDRVAEFWRLYRVRIYQRLLVLTGLEGDPQTAPEVIEAEAAARMRDGWSK